MQSRFFSGKFLSRRTVVLMSVCLSLAPLSVRAAITVTWRQERLSVQADKVSPARILREIARRSGIEIRGGEGLQEPVSVCFTDLPLHEGLQKLALNSLVLWKVAPPRSGQRPVLAMVSAWKGTLPPQSCSLSTVAKETSSTPAPPAPPMPQQKFPKEKQTIRAAAAAMLTGQNQQEALATLLEGTKSEDTTTRVEALRALSQSDHVEAPLVLSVLQTALTDKDETVRGYAEQILEEREAAADDLARTPGATEMTK